MGERWRGKGSGGDLETLKEVNISEVSEKQKRKEEGGLQLI